jgi:hypothetical protein
VNEDVWLSFKAAEFEMSQPLTFALLSYLVNTRKNDAHTELQIPRHLIEDKLKSKCEYKDLKGNLTICYNTKALLKEPENVIQILRDY